MANYAGVPLPQPTGELAAWVAKNIPLSDVVPFHPTPSLNKLLTVLPYPDIRLRPVKMGSLWWPIGAARWAIGHFLACESDLAKIRIQVYPDDVSYRAATLVLDDGTDSGQLFADMWMLPPRPLAQSDSAGRTKWLLPRSIADNGEAVYLLTLVDERFFWWQRPSTVAIAVGSTTWGQLITAISENLAAPISAGDIESVYLLPPASLSAFVKYLPLLLDLCAFNTGRRVVRDPSSGAVILQTATVALALGESKLAQFGPGMAGGLLAFDNVA